MASAAPSARRWISTPCRLANANGKFRWAAAAAPLGTSTSASALPRFAAIGRGAVGYYGLGRRLIRKRELFVLGQRRQRRPLELAHQHDGVGGQLSLQILDIAVLRVSLEARVRGRLQDRRADEHHEVRLAAIGRAGTEQPAEAGNLAEPRD